MEMSSIVANMTGVQFSLSITETNSEEIKKIGMIKDIRTIFGLGLVSSKDFVEDLMRGDEVVISCELEAFARFVTAVRVMQQRNESWCGHHVYIGEFKPVKLQITDRRKYYHFLT